MKAETKKIAELERQIEEMLRSRAQVEEEVDLLGRDLYVSRQSITSMSEAMVVRLAQSDAERDIARSELADERAMHIVTLDTLSRANKSCGRAIEALDTLMCRYEESRALNGSLRSLVAGLTSYATRISGMRPDLVEILAVDIES